MSAPTFYCENCRKEVSANDNICPACGRFFTDVRCPRCNYSGEADEFGMGCPKCGYLNPAWLTGTVTSASSSAFFEVISPRIFDSEKMEPEIPRQKSAQLPPWFFLAFTIGLGIVCAAAVYLFIR
jgi:hypothetical protein